MTTDTCAMVLDSKDDVVEVVAPPPSPILSPITKRKRNQKTENCAPSKKKKKKTDRQGGLTMESDIKDDLSGDETEDDDRLAKADRQEESDRKGEAVYLPTKGIEAELEKLGIQVVDESSARLPFGWTTKREGVLHNALTHVPVTIYKSGCEVARVLPDGTLKLTEKKKIYHLGTKGIETQLQKLGIEIIDEAKVRLPFGWSIAPRPLHNGAPTLILNEHKVEVARWDGGCKFFVVQEDGYYSKEDLNYMESHIHCHADCHTIRTNQKRLAEQKKAEKAREARVKRKKLADEVKTNEPKTKKTRAEITDFELGPTPPPEYKTEPIPEFIYWVEINGVGKGNIQKKNNVDDPGKPVPFPTSIPVKNMKLAEEIKKLLLEGRTAKAFTKEVRNWRAGSKYGTHHYLILQFGRTVEEDEKFVPIFLQQQEKKQWEEQQSRKIVELETLGTKLRADAIWAKHSKEKGTRIDADFLKDLKSNIVQMEFDMTPQALAELRERELLSRAECIAEYVQTVNFRNRMNQK